MRERADAKAPHAASEQRTAARPSSPGAPARSAAPSPARALALQRAAGNRATARTLARWTMHPDEEQKGVMIPDSAAEKYLRLNPPKNE